MHSNSLYVEETSSFNKGSSTSFRMRKEYGFAEEDSPMQSFHMLPNTRYCLLPRAHDHPLTTLIVRRVHKCICHNGVKETRTEARRRFWIPRGRSLTKYIVHYCVLCRRLEGAPFKTPPPPPLPTSRVKEDPAFMNTGVDFASPLSICASDMSTTSKV